MKIYDAGLNGLLVCQPQVFRDERGWFRETWREPAYQQAGIREQFVQDNLSYSRHGVLRGLHFQHPHGQGKLVSVVRGEVYDVAVDLRVGSPTFAQWRGFVLSEENALQVYIPPGFAHGFLVISDDALFLYKCTALFRPDADRNLAWNDPEMNIPWPILEPVLSPRDRSAPTLSLINSGSLPHYERAYPNPNMESWPSIS